MNPSKAPIAIITLIVLVLVLIGISSSAFTVVDPGNRGVMVTLGSVSPDVLPEGVHFKMPFVTKIDQVSVRTTKIGFSTSCYSSDLQQVKANIAVIYAIPEDKVVNIYRNYAGDPFNQFVNPLVQEALKEVASSRSAERLVKEREAIKMEVLASLRKKVNGLVTIVDLAIENFDLSTELERAIEAKMVQEQDAAKAKFAQQQAQIEAETASIRAEGEANAIRIRGEALKQNAALISLQIVEKWNGVTPTTVVIGNGSEGSAANILLPISK